MRAGCWYDTQMQIGKASGWLLLVAAFFLAAAETAAHAITGEYGIMGIARVMEILVPAFFVELAGAVREACTRRFGIRRC